jgi:hypothetical protein
MRQPGILAATCGLLLLASALSAAAKEVVVGANVYDEGFITQPLQDAEVDRLAGDGVKAIRTGLGVNSVHFITEAYQHGIGTVADVNPAGGTTAKTKTRWSDFPLSQLDPKEFAAWFKPLLDKLEASGVRLTAFELGNEINTSGYNSDIPAPGSGRVLGLADLNNPKDPEAPAIAKGLRNYLKIMATLKDLRDHSRLNRDTPILLAGIADWGLPGPKAWDGLLGVALPDTIAFLRQNGLDTMADGYGVHVYPTGDPKASVAARVAELDGKKLFSECGAGARPCWLTEWGIGNASKACPIDDSRRSEAIAAERSALSQFVRQGKLAAMIYYTWDGFPPGSDPDGIYRCGALTAAGKQALRPE